MTQLPPETVGNWRIQIKALERGDRWCVGCGTVCIARSEPAYVIRCGNCYRDFMETKGKGRALRVIVAPNTMREFLVSSAGFSKYCKTCGSQLEKDRVDYALRHSGGRRECTQCLGCVRGWNRPVHGVSIPTHWHSYLDELFPAAA